MREPRLIRAASLTGYAALARTLGLDPYRLVAEAGLPAGALADPDLLIPAAAVGRLLERSAERANAPDFGLRLAEHRSVANLGAVGLAAREQPTLGAAVELLIRYSWTHNQAIALELERGGETALIRQSLAGGGLARQANELAIGVLIGSIRRLIGGAWRPVEVVFMHPAPIDLATHRRVLGVTPRFLQDFNGIALDAGDLDRPIPAADPEAARRLHRYVETDGLRRGDDLTPVVRDLILSLLPTGACGFERVARQLGLAPRTLRRRLAARGVVFEGLVDQARRELAATYQAQGRSLTEIAGLLGYSSLSAYSRRRARLKASSPP